MTVEIRSDIQVLRGFAVLLVLFYHSDVLPIPGGYLGVDIFFVISGYLITGMVARDHVRGTFSFKNFYFRRAKRLLPAAYVTFLLTSLAAPFVLGAQELNDYYKQLLGALTFTGNIALFFQSGYFDSAAELKPLLHVWSLSIEEQYYLIIPALVVFTPRKYWLTGGIILLSMSLALCFVMTWMKPIASFYLLPTRAWEMGIGSLAALIQLQQGAQPAGRFSRFISMSFWPALMIGAGLPFLSPNGPHPGIDALVACIATALVILRQHMLFEKLPLLKWVGNFSYSLYLVHWPIFAAVKNSNVGEPALTQQVIALCASLLLGWALYRWVERPVRRMEITPNKKSITAAIAATFAVLFTSPVIAGLKDSTIDFADLRKPNDGFSKACIYEGEFVPLKECMNQDKPQILVWGDSHAMHLVTGIAATTTKGVQQATRGMCGPIIGVAPLSDVFYNRAWASDCLKFNQAVFDYIASSSHLETIVLSSALLQYLDAEHKKHRWRLLVEDQQGLSEQPASVEMVAKELHETIEKLRSTGKRVIVIASPPGAGFNIGSCIERKTKGMWVLGSPTDDCTIPYASYQTYRRLAIELLRSVSEDKATEVISFEQHLCNETKCLTRIDDTLLYVDNNHFTYQGITLLAERIGLGSLIEGKSH